MPDPITITIVCVIVGHAVLVIFGTRPRYLTDRGLGAASAVVAILLLAAAAVSREIGPLVAAAPFGAIAYRVQRRIAELGRQ